MASPHPRLRTPDRRFVLLGSHGEELKKPFEKSWQETANYQHDDPKLAAHRGNYGVCGGFGDLHILDSDDLARWQELEILPLIPTTFTIESRPGHRQFYVTCKEPFKSGGLFDPEKTEPNEAGKPEYIHIGDLKAGGGMVVGPGCKHPSGSIYTVVEDVPIAEVSREHLQSIIKKFRQSKKVNGNYQKAEEQGKNDKKRRYEEKDPLDSLRVVDIMPPAGETSQNGDELRGDHPVHGSTNGGNYVINLDKNLWHCKRCEAGGGAALAIAVKHGLISCSEAGPGELRGDLFRQVLAIANENYGMPGNGNGTGAKAEEQADLLERIKADPRALKENAILAALAALKTNDRIEYDLLVDAIKKAHKGLKVDTIHALVDKYIQESKKATEKPQETPKSIIEKARAIAERGDPFKYAIWQAQRNHLGDIDYQKVLIASIASAASQTSNGIQPGGNGDKGSGKSDACAATYHLVPMDRRLDGSLSPMSLFYLQEMGRLRSGMILFSDDVEYDGIIPIYKRSTARFQHGITHFSVSGGKDRKGIELIVPPRMVWWLTSVESVANEQAFDRQYPISTDSSAGHKKRVSREIADRRARKELRLAEDEGIEVARAIIADIFDNGPFKVLVPQSTKSMWLKVADFRGQEQFWDLVDALVILRWRQHKQDLDGWLIAEDKDLIEAKGILTGHKVAHFADLTEAEAKLIGVMSSGHSMTQKELTEALGVAQSTLSERLRSIMAKSAIITEDYDQGKKIYALNPKMQLGADYWGGLDLIDLKIDNNEDYRSQKIALSACYRYVIGLPIGIIINNSDRIPSSLSVNVEESIERDTCSCEKCLGWEESIPSSILISAKTTDNDQKQQQAPLSDTDKPTETEPIRTDNDSSGGPDIPIRQAGGAVDEKAPTSGPHPRKAEPTPAKLKSIYVSEGPALEYSPFSLNLHNGCSHDCQYCYAKKRFIGTCETRVKKSSLANIESDLKGWQGERKPVHLTFQGDPYDLGRQDNSEVRKALELFRKYNHPFQVLTKGGTKAVQDFDLYGPTDRFGSTLTFLNDVDSMKWEPAAALPGDRIEALRQAHSRKIKTWASLEPVIDPAQTLALIEATHDFVDHYGVGKMNHNPEIEKNIDWPKFRADAEALLKKYGKSYQIKADLMKAAPEEPAQADISEPIRTAAISEYGMAGWVDPAKLAHVLKLPFDVVEAWLQANYVAYDRPNGGGIGYRQRRAGEAQT